MSAASFSSSSSSKTQKGFSEARFRDFLNRGNNLTDRRATNGQAIGAFRPKEQSRTTTTTTKEAGSLATLFGASDEGTKTRTSGFLGQFASGVTAEKLDSLTNTFLQRQRSIQQRRSQPGRSALFLSRS